MTELYTNRSSRKDFIKNGILKNVDKNMDIFIATAFFTNIDMIEQLLKEDCHIRIVVRLGFPTSPKALDRLIQNKKVEARFFTNHAYHPKLYIFGDKNLLVGSANLTEPALITNQEIMVNIDSKNKCFEEIRALFAEY